MQHQKFIKMTIMRSREVNRVFNLAISVKIGRHIRAGRVTDSLVIRTSKRSTFPHSKYSTEHSLQVRLDHIMPAGLTVNMRGVFCTKGALKHYLMPHSNPDKMTAVVTIGGEEINRYSIDKALTEHKIVSRSAELIRIDYDTSTRLLDSMRGRRQVQEIFSGFDS